MKKFGVVLAILAIVALIGCGSGTTGGATVEEVGEPPFIVDLSKLGGKLNLAKVSDVEKKANTFSDSRQIKEKGQVVGIRNVTAFKKAWENLLIELPPSALPSDFSKYKRLTITARYYEANGDEIESTYSQAMVSLIYKMDSDDIRNENASNVPVKAFNVGSNGPGDISTSRGVRITFKQAPEAILLQNNGGSDVAFIDLTGIIFHNGNFTLEEE